MSEPGRFLQPGSNGPYKDFETPVRNYGHWLLTFSKCYEINHDKKFLNKVNEFAEYLISNDSRPSGHSFHHRNSPNWDKCNGLIGQAWTFEALACASSVLRNKKFAEVAEEVFFQHKFNVEYGLWHRLEISGDILSIDETFNHQLWFAACASLLKTPRVNEIHQILVRFMECLPQNITVLDNGLIYHPIERKLNENRQKKLSRWNLKNAIRSVTPIFERLSGKTKDVRTALRAKMIHKSIGYHQFNMYAFAILKDAIPEHPFWVSEKFSKSVSYLMSDAYKNGLFDNEYGYNYNPPGFEVPYAISVFSKLNLDESDAISSFYINEQFKRSYNVDSKMMDRNTDDPLTHTARVYEITRFENSMLERIQVEI